MAHAAGEPSEIDIEPYLELIRSAVRNGERIAVEIEAVLEVLPHASDWRQYRDTGRRRITLRVG